MPPSKAGGGQNPNVCSPCECLVESGPLADMQELISTLSKIVAINEGQLSPSIAQTTKHDPSSQKEPVVASSEDQDTTSGTELIPVVSVTDDFIKARRN